ncbi:chemotaxis protein CheW [Motiliproteus sp. MSK22-1]|uniref:chemotaxis protein CheW n=1 Tax=Motiliproteus sp. MSK22-1 TaxID=1897630 RepID=UPI0009753A85|nr:chemotaxis protein CheW [Motiliproteus sp. MSK22-1]OMH32674.1 hypothetical protein BGP75_14115 [Motiliproteus sp. MSK22-1]
MMIAGMDAVSISQSEISKWVLHVVVGTDTRICIDLADVTRVFPLVSVEEVPGGPDYLVGFVSFHGVSIPIIDLALKLGLTEVCHYDTETPIVLCRAGTLTGGLVVNQVLEVAQPQFKDIQMVDEFSNSRPSVSATVSIPQGLSLLINTAKVLSINLTESVNEVEPPAKSPECGETSIRDSR